MRILTRQCYVKRRYASWRAAKPILATENDLLAALGLGLGAVWCGLHPKQERVNVVRQILGIPEEIIPFSYIVVGHPAEEKEARTQYDATRVHYGRW